MDVDKAYSRARDILSEDGNLDVDCKREGHGKELKTTFDDFDPSILIDSCHDSFPFGEAFRVVALMMESQDGLLSHLHFYLVQANENTNILEVS